MVRSAKDNALSAIGGAAGAAVGVVAFHVLWSQDFYALVLPGAFLGLGCYALSRTRSVPRGVVAAILAIILGLGVEWRYRPFVADGSLLGFLTRIPQLKPVTLVMIGVGALFAFWWGRDARISPVPSPRSEGG